MLVQTHACQLPHGSGGCHAGASSDAVAATRDTSPLSSASAIEGAPTSAAELQKAQHDSALPGPRTGLH